MSNYTQDMTGNRSFPEKPSPDRKPSLHNVPAKVTPFGNKSAGMAGFGEQGEGVEYNADAPFGNKKLVQSPFVQNQGHGGQDPKHLGTPAETSIRNVRTADLGASFGNGKLEGSVEIAGKHQSLPKKFLPGGRSV